MPILGDTTQGLDLAGAFSADSAYVLDSFVASSSFTVNRLNAWIAVENGSDTAKEVKLLLFNSSGTLLAVGGPLIVAANIGPLLVQQPIPEVNIVSGSSYILGAIDDSGETRITGTITSGVNNLSIDVNNYASPVNLTAFETFFPDFAAGGIWADFAGGASAAWFRA